MPEAPPESASYCSTSVAFLQLLFEAKSWLAFVMTATELSLPRSLDGSSCEAGQMAEYVYRVHGELVEGLDRVRGFEAKSLEILRYGLDTS